MFITACNTKLKKKKKKIVTYRENEVVATLKNLYEKLSSSPHHLDEILGHVNFFSPKIQTVRFQYVAVQPSKQAAIVGRLIHCHDQKVVKQWPSVFP